MFVPRLASYLGFFFCELSVYILCPGFPGGTSGKEPANEEDRRDRFDPWVGKIPWRRTWQHTSVVLPGESHGQRSQAGYNPWGRRAGHD